MAGNTLRAYATFQPPQSYNIDYIAVTVEIYQPNANTTTNPRVRAIAVVEPRDGYTSEGISVNVTYANLSDPNNHAFASVGCSSSSESQTYYGSWSSAAWVSHSTGNDTWKFQISCAGSSLDRQVTGQIYWTNSPSTQVVYAPSWIKINGATEVSCAVPGTFTLTWGAGGVSSGSVSGYRLHSYRWGWGNTSEVIDEFSTNSSTFSYNFSKSNTSAVGHDYVWRIQTLGSGGSYSANSTAYVLVHYVSAVTTYTITLNANGGSVSSSSVTGQYGSIVSLPTPTRTGYSFAGWYMNCTGSNYINFGNTYKYTSTVSFSFNTYSTNYNYGTSGKTYNVISSGYNGNAGISFFYSGASSYKGGYNTSSSWPGLFIAASSIPAGFHSWHIIVDGPNKTIKTYMDGVQLPSGNPALPATTITYASNNTMVGYGGYGTYWTGYVGNLTIQNKVLSASALGVDKNLITCPNQNVTLYALWEPEKYQVSYNANGGTSTPSTQVKTYGVTLTLAAAISKTATKSTSTVTYTTTFNATTNGGASNSSKTNTKTTVTTQPYTFAKWRAGSTTGTSYSAGGAYTTNASTTMYATWSNGTATSTTTTTSITFPAIPSHATTSTSRTYTVSYNANGGTGTTTAQSVTQTATVSYTANKWWTAQTSGGTSYAAGATITPTASSTYYARYTASTGTYSAPTIALRSALTFASVTSTTTAAATVYFSAATTVASQGSTRTIVTTQPKKFDKWRLGSATGTSYAAGATFTPTANTTFYATSTNNGSATSVTTYSAVTLPTVPSKSNTSVTTTRTVYYNANGGTGTTTAQSVTPSATVTWSDDDKWWTTSSGGTGYSQGGNYTPAALSTTLYAHYTASTGTYSSPTISLRSALTKASTASTVTTTITLNFSAASSVAAKTTTKTVVTTQPYSFAKWRLGSTTGTSYSAGATFTPTATSATFYATWSNGTASTATTRGQVTLPTVPAKANTSDSESINISFSYNGASGTTPSALSSSRSRTNTWADDNNWYTTSALSTVAGAQGTAYTLTADNGTVYAKYTETKGTWSAYSSITLPSAPTTVKPNTTATKYVTYNLNNGTTVSAASTSFVATTKYKFGGWTTSTSGTSGTAAGGAYTPTAATTLYAAWAVSTTTAAAITTATASKDSTTANKTVRFYLNDDIGNYSSYTSKTFVATTSYTMDGWYTASSGGTKRADNGGTYTPPVAGETVYAQWTGTTTAASVVAPVPIRTGYTCTGYYTAATGGTRKVSAGGTYTPPVAGETLYAQWAELPGYHEGYRCCYIYQTSDNAWHKAIPYIYMTDVYKQYVVNDTNVNIRKGPATTYEVVGQMDMGDTFSASDTIYHPTGSGSTAANWKLILSGQYAGYYISADYCTAGSVAMPGWIRTEAHIYDSNAWK